MKECSSRPVRTFSYPCAGRLGGTDLGQLREAVEREFLTLDERERSVRSVLAKMEGDLIRRMASLHND